jgi:hypothetical protein
MFPNNSQSSLGSFVENVVGFPATYGLVSWSQLFSGLFQTRMIVDVFQTYLSANQTSIVRWRVIASAILP